MNDGGNARNGLVGQFASLRRHDPDQVLRVFFSVPISRDTPSERLKVYARSAVPATVFRPTIRTARQFIAVRLLVTAALLAFEADLLTIPVPESQTRSESGLIAFLN
jgi:hypothetical protein